MTCRSTRRLIVLVLLLMATFQSALAADGVDVLRTKAGQGEPAALFNLAARHERGDGVRQDLSIATILYEQAARRGHAGSFYRLGLAKAAGLGSPIDLVTAFGWLKLAADKETPSAILAESLLQTIGDRMDESERKDALAFAEAFTPVTGTLDDDVVALLEAPSSVDTATLPAPDADSLCSTYEQTVAEGKTQRFGFAVESELDLIAQDLKLISVKPAICDVLKLLDGSTLLDPTINLVLRNQNGAIPETFADGDFLIVEASAGDPSRQIFIDYVVHDGTVVHLFPTTATPEDPRTESTRLQIGGPGTGAYEWQVGAPYGNDLVIFYSSDEPLHAAPREDVETVENYLPYLRDRLAKIAAASKLGIDYHVLQTVAR